MRAVMWVCALVVSAGAGADAWTADQTRLLSKFHRMFMLGERGVTLEDAKAMVEKHAPEFGSGRRSFKPQTSVSWGCSDVFGQCLTKIWYANLKTTDHPLDTVWQECDTKTCGCVVADTLSCNEECDASATAEEAADCRREKCITKESWAGGIQLAEIDFFDSAGNSVMAAFSGITVVTGGNTTVGEGPEMMVDGKPGTKYFDKSRGRIKVELTFDKLVNIASFEMTTAADSALRDPAGWMLYTTTNTTWQLSSEKNDGEFMPRERGAKTGKIPVDFCQDASNTCADALNSGSYTCAGSFCDGCEYDQYCIKTCDSCPPDTPRMARSVRLYLTPKSECEDDLIKPDDYTSENAQTVNAKCSVPYMWTVPDDFYCNNNFLGMDECKDDEGGVEGECQWNRVITEYNATMQKYVDVFPGATCRQLGACDDSRRCEIEAMDAYLELYPTTPCEYMWSCVKHDMDSYLDDCTENHVTADGRGNVCDQAPMCANIQAAYDALPEGVLNCNVEINAVLSENNRYLKPIAEQCSQGVCDYYGEGAKVGFCGDQKDCCIEVVEDGETALKPVFELKTISDVALQAVHLTCEQMEWTLSFDAVCAAALGATPYMAPDCKSYGVEYVWSGKDDVGACLDAGDIWHDKDMNLCNTTRICDKVRSAFLPRCDSKPAGPLQACSNSHIEEGGLVVNMTLDTDGVCRCPAGMRCDSNSGFCLHLPPTLAPATQVPTQAPSAAPATHVPTLPPGSTHGV
ncbi:hypothetical protein DIPPA_30848 [Diplonema papillatum]|nr:hypothetical protein DIPPA_30848 [Diplonema papillatum]